MIAQFCLATETPGLDGWTPVAIRSLDEVSAKCNCALLDDCGEGLFPFFFAQARCVGVPKPGSLERRPLTSLSALYRVWASRMAVFTGTWMAACMPPEVYGARKGSSACDASWRFTLLVSRSKAMVVTVNAVEMHERQTETIATVVQSPPSRRKIA